MIHYLCILWNDHHNESNWPYMIINSFSFDKNFKVYSLGSLHICNMVLIILTTLYITSSGLMWGWFIMWNWLTGSCNCRGYQIPRSVRWAARPRRIDDLFLSTWGRVSLLVLFWPSSDLKGSLTICFTQFTNVSANSSKNILQKHPEFLTRYLGSLWPSQVDT